MENQHPLHPTNGFTEDDMEQMSLDDVRRLCVDLLKNAGHIGYEFTANDMRRIIAVRHCLGQQVEEEQVEEDDDAPYF